jgi:putative nucleotidyltransferase with HDIG domain
VDKLGTAALAQRLQEILPEIASIRDAGLRDKVVGCWLDALASGGWSPDDLAVLPASLRLADRPFRLVHHVRGVAQLAIAAHQMFRTLYGVEAIRLDSDVLLAGALLHDVGKPMEFACVDGTWRLSGSGRSFRHPFGGFAIAAQRDVPWEVLEIIAYHSTEGQGFPRSAEDTIINLVDAINFTPFFAGQG